jgi:RNA recognition motif-containing protein
MPGKSEAQKALESLNTYELKGKRINVNEARPQRERGGRRF